MVYFLYKCLYPKYAKYFLFIRQWNSVLLTVNAKIMEKMSLASINH